LCTTFRFLSAEYCAQQKQLAKGNHTEKTLSMALSVAFIINMPLMQRPAALPRGVW